MERYDVVIVGAGPAGALAALVLSRAGRRVALLDKAEFPREKLCGDCLNPSCGDLWEKYGLRESFRKLPQHRIRGISIERDHDTLYESSRPDSAPPFIAVERALLDQWLVQQAEAAGTVFFPATRVQSLGKEGLVVTSSGSFQGDYILGTDGRNSIIAREAGLAAPLRTCKRVAWQATVPLETMDDRVHLRFFAEGYYGLTRVNERDSNLCLVLHPSAAGTPQKIAHQSFPKLPACVWHSVSAITRPPAELGKGRVWLAGDAARVVEPFTGEGIYFAMASGELAALAILESGGDAVKGLQLYRKSHAALYKRARLNRGIRWLLVNPKRAYHATPWLARIPGLMAKLVQQILG